MKNIEYPARRERGIALLFALGILTLLLIVCLAFAANALLSQKVAVNNSSRSQADILARAAINRVAASVMLYHMELGEYTKNNLETAGKDDVLLTDFSTVVSHYRRVGAVKDDSTTQDYSDDQLDELLPPYKRIVLGGSGTDTFYSDMDSADIARKPNWVFVDNGETGTDRRIVGRFAYRILPPRSNSRINLNKILKQTTPGTSDPLYVGIDEIPLTDTPLGFWNPGTADPDHYADSLDLFIKAWRAKFTSGSEEDISLWLKRWFDDGVSRGDLDIFESTDSAQTLRRFYHRFNLRRDQSDWNSFAGKTANSKAAVLALMGEAHEFRNSTGNVDSDDDFDITDSTAKSPKNSGLEYLNIIGGADIGGFSSHAAFRKQIAANLLDYCDSDDIPTSDIAATDWDSDTLLLDNASAWPMFTGNEKNPYINELAFGFLAEPKLNSGGDWKDDLTLTVDITPELIGELINIYNNSHAADRYELKTAVKELELRVEVVAKGKIVYDTSSATGLTADVNTAEAPKQKDYVFISTPLTANIDFKSGETWQNGYLVGSRELTSLKQSLEFKFDDTVTVPGDATMVTKGYFTDVKITIVSGSMRFGGITLLDTDNSRTGVDFVRWEPDAGSTYVATATNPIMIYHDAPGVNSGFYQASEITSFPPAEYRRFYLGGFEVKDPRQNLNVRDSVESDWSNFNNGIQLGDHNNNNMDATPRETISINVTFNGAGISRLANGKRNRESDPSIVNSAGPGDYDEEFATDPAWVGPAREQHLSTAYIRNAPMLSAWELGAIHRAYPWRTIRLNKVTNFELEDHKGWVTTPNKDSDGINNQSGISYDDGDGAILDQVKLSPEARSWGKIDLNMFRNDSLITNGSTSLNGQLLRSLLLDVPIVEFYDSTIGVNSAATDVLDTVRAALIDNLNVSSVTEMFARSEGIQYLRLPDTAIAGGLTKAEYDAIPGNLLNLMKTGPGLVTSFQAVIVAQSILDVEGPVRRIKYNGDLSNQHNATYGVFDFDSSNELYFDQITGEVRLLVTYDRNPATGKIKVRSIEYLQGDNYNLLP